MIDRLDRNQQERVEKQYHDHPLLCACQSTFRNYQARMNYLMFSPTEVFVEVVKVLDALFEKGADPLHYIRNLWEELTIRYKLWCMGVPDEEVQMSISSICYVVAIVLSRHSQTFFSETVKDAVLNEIDTHISVVKQEEDKVIVCLSSYADKLEAWITDYSNRDYYLSDEIDDIANGRKPRARMTVMKKDSKKESKKKKTKKPIEHKDYSRYSFKAAPKLNLDRFYDLLTERDDSGKRYIDDMMKHNDACLVCGISEKELKQYKPDVIEKMMFNQVFSGAETFVRIVWLRNANELLYLIDTMQNYIFVDKNRNCDTPLLDRIQPGPEIWELTRFRFLNGKPRKMLDERTGKQVIVTDPIEFKDDAFAHQNYPANTTRLDDIISKIAPKRKQSLDEEVQSDMRSLDNYEDRNKNLNGNYNSGENDKMARLRDEGHFRDTNHKGKFE